MDLTVAVALAACALVYVPLLSYLIVYDAVTGVGPGLDRHDEEV